MLTYSAPSSAVSPVATGSAETVLNRRVDDHRLAQIVDLAAVVEVAAAEAGQHFDMLGVEGEVALGGEAGEARARARLDRQGVVAEQGLGIEQDVAQADLGEGIALLRQPQQHVGLGRLDVDGDDRPAGLERQGLAGDVRAARCRGRRSRSSPKL